MKFSPSRRRGGEISLVDGAQAEAVVQDRPSLSGITGATRGRSGWLLLGVDLIFSSIAVVITLLLAGPPVFPAFPIAPVLLVLAYGALGVYGRPSPGHPNPNGSPIIRLLVAALFAWSVGLVTQLQPLEQLALWAIFVVSDAVARAAIVGPMHRLEPVERWVLVGEESTAARLRSYAPLEPYAKVVASVLPDEHASRQATRSTALDIVERNQADRVVITTKHADDRDLLDLVQAFKSCGIPVSLMPRPLDLLEAPAVTPRQFGGVPLFEIGALASRDRMPYQGPERRGSRTAKVSVVVPTLNEEKNVVEVLGRLPEGLHEVILVDGRSTDRTVEAAEAAYPRIKVVLQRGRGKGDALRAGFAAVTGTAVVMLDADGSADPAEITRFIDALEAGADFAKGSRYLPAGGSDDLTGLRNLGNTVLSGTANLLHGTRFTDLCYGYNAFWTRCLPFISLDVPGFEVETLINLRIAGAGMKITEVPSYELLRIHGQSNLNTFRDGYRVLKTIFAEARRNRVMRKPPRTPHQDDRLAADRDRLAADRS
jgi:hypothetical protein